MSKARILAIAALLSTAMPAVAAADVLLIPWFGVNFGGDSGKEFSDAADSSRFTYGASIAWMGGGVFGFEGDFGFSPDFFGKTDVGNSSVFTAMGNVLIGVPFGGQQGFGVRPFALAGVGVIKPQGDAFADQFEFNDTKVGWNFGGGILMFFSSHVGIRGDIRYFRTFEALDVLGIDVNEDPGDLDFTRGSLGFVIRF